MLLQNGKQFLLQVTAWQGFIATGALAEQIRLYAQLVSSAPVEQQSQCHVLQEHIALKQETLIQTTAPSVPLDTTVKVGNLDFPRVTFSEKSKSIFLHLKFKHHMEIHIQFIFQL